tara:strand:- start:1800 stop:1961 length:162 start_codon:yes stop_codon:yes gene_type:complete
LRTQVHAEALGLNPLEKGEEDVSQLQERLELLKEERKEKNRGLSSRGHEKRSL